MMRRSGLIRSRVWAYQWNTKICIMRSLVFQSEALVPIINGALGVAGAIFRGKHVDLSSDLHKQY
jgi:hypothetical protein